uniref:Uncharacterized protein n=1 Tax=Trichogramma kaykai TaxID=54128 RepID=A0ABD2WLX4_9HYME
MHEDTTRYIETHRCMAKKRKRKEEAAVHIRPKAFSSSGKMQICPLYSAIRILNRPICLCMLRIKASTAAFRTTSILVASPGQFNFFLACRKVASFFLLRTCLLACICIHNNENVTSCSLAPPPSHHQQQLLVYFAGCDYLAFSLANARAHRWHVKEGFVKNKSIKRGKGPLHNNRKSRMISWTGNTIRCSQEVSKYIVQSAGREVHRIYIVVRATTSPSELARISALVATHQSVDARACMGELTRTRVIYMHEQKQRAVLVADATK